MKRKCILRTLMKQCVQNISFQNAQLIVMGCLLWKVIFGYKLSNINKEKREYFDFIQIQTRKRKQKKTLLLTVTNLIRLARISKNKTKQNKTRV